MTEDELEVFIAEQKARIAKERQQLQFNKSLDKSQDKRRDGLGASGSKENIPPSHSNREPAQSSKQGGAVTEVGRALPRGSYSNLREKLNAERREEYNRFLADKKMRSGPQNGDGKKEETANEKDSNNSLGIGERNSAKLKARRVRNQEYNDYLKQKGGTEKTREQSQSDEQKIRNMNGIGRNSPRERSQQNEPSRVNGSSRPRQSDHYDTSRSSRPRHPDDYDKYQKDTSSQTPVPRFEQSRHYDDIPPPPRRGWGTPVHLDYDDILRKKREEEARYRRYDDDLDYYRGRGIRPSVSDPYLNRSGHHERRRYYDRYEDDRDYDGRRVRFDEDRGRDRGCYTRHDDMYDDTDHNYFREERSRTMPEMESKEQKSPKKPTQSSQPEPVNSRKPRPKSADDEGFFIGQRQSQSASQRKKAEYRKELEKQMEESKQTKRRNRNMEREEELKVNATGLQDPEKMPDRLKGLPNPVARPGPSHTYNTPKQSNQYQPSFAPQVHQDLGLDAAMFKSKAPMLDKPFDLDPYHYKSDSVDPYMYYGVRNPMEGEPGAPSGMNPYYNGYNDGGYTGPSQYAHGQSKPAPQNTHSSRQGYHSALDPRPTQPIQKTGQSSIQNFMGDDSKTPRKKKDLRSYQDELLLQIQEKERRKREDKVAQERYDIKMEEEAKHYQPFGKGGGGAPMRDNKGHIIADLKQVKQMQTSDDLFGGSVLNNQVGHPEISPRGQLPTYHNAPELGIGNGIVLDASPTNAQDEYKESLKQQIEDKKRRQAEEKERERLREEKQERDLKEQRDKIQREFEVEKEKQRLKEEKTRQQNKELAEKAEEMRKEADMKQASLEVKQPRRMSDVRKDTSEPRVESPPIPTLRKDPPRNDSPPIPTLRKKQEQNQIPSTRNDSPVVPSLRQMQGDKTNDGRTSPPVPAVTTKERAGEKDRDVMSALSTMRKQLQSEQRRVQQALEREYDPYTHVPSSHGSRRSSPQVNVLDLERKKKPKPVSVRREFTNHAAAQDFNSLKDRGSHSRQKVREQYPNKPTTDIALEAQQRALLRQQQDKLDTMRKAYRPSAYDTTPLNLHNIGRRLDSPMIALESSSAFIGIDSGESKIPADERSLPGSARTRDVYGDIGSINEDALDVLERKNLERIAALAAIDSDGMSNEDPDDILQKFMSKGSSNRPPSGKSEDLSLWLQPTGY